MLKTYSLIVNIIIHKYIKVDIVKYLEIIY